MMRIVDEMRAIRSSFMETSPESDGEIDTGFTEGEEGRVSVFGEMTELPLKKYLAGFRTA